MLQETLRLLQTLSLETILTTYRQYSCNLRFKISCSPNNVARNHTPTPNFVSRDNPTRVLPAGNSVEDTFAASPEVCRVPRWVCALLEGVWLSRGARGTAAPTMGRGVGPASMGVTTPQATTSWRINALFAQQMWWSMKILYAFQVQEMSFNKRYLHECIIA